MGKSIDELLTKLTEEAQRRIVENIERSILYVPVPRREVTPAERLGRFFHRAAREEGIRRVRALADEWGIEVSDACERECW